MFDGLRSMFAALVFGGLCFWCLSCGVWCFVARGSWFVVRVSCYVVYVSCFALGV